MARQPGPPNANQDAPEGAATPPPPAGIAGAPTSLVDFVTGPTSPNRTLERFGISGTDLGIPWDNGDPANPQVLMAFGDTFGYCKVHGQQWRYNTLFRSQDHDLAHGIHVADGVPNNPYSGSPVWAPGLSKQVVPSIHKAAHETGVIPTAAVSIGRTQYMSFMSIKNWGRDGEWSTNYSGIARSNDNGQTWGIFPGTVRLAAADTVPGGRFFPGNENFQMGAFMQGKDGYMYSFGTPSGRSGAAFLSRVPPNALPDLTKYQYWNGDGKGWVPVGSGRRDADLPGPGRRDVSAVQRLPQAVSGALHQRWQQRRHRADRAGTGRAVESRAAAGVVVPDARWHLRADDPSVVERQRPVLQPVAVVGVRRDVDAHRAAVVRQTD